MEIDNAHFELIRAHALQEGLRGARRWWFKALRDTLNKHLSQLLVLLSEK